MVAKSSFIWTTNTQPAKPIRIQRMDEEQGLRRNQERFEAFCSKLNTLGINIDNIGVTFVIGAGPPGNEVTEKIRHEFNDITTGRFLFRRSELKNGQKYLADRIRELVQDWENNYIIDPCFLKTTPEFKALIQRLRKQVGSLMRDYRSHLLSYQDKQARDIITGCLKRARRFLPLDRLEDVVGEELDLLKVRETMEE